MKRLLLLGTMLIWGGAASAQDAESVPDYCPASARPVIEQTNVATVERNGDTDAVIQIDVAASLPDGRPLTYAYSAHSGSITSAGPRATWTVEGAGPFTATVEVSAADYPCSSYVEFTYNMDGPAPE